MILQFINITGVTTWIVAMVIAEPAVALLLALHDEVATERDLVGVTLVLEIRIES